MKKKIYIYIYIIVHIYIYIKFYSLCTKSGYKTKNYILHTRISNSIKRIVYQL